MNDPARRGCGACRRYFRPAARRNLLAFWLLGLLNNAGYVVMNAGAKEITPCLVGLVYVANVVPSFCTKLSLPFWQHRVGYRTRLAGATALMAASFLVVVAGNVAGSPGVPAPTAAPARSSRRRYLRWAWCPPRRRAGADRGSWRAAAALASAPA